MKLKFKLLVDSSCGWSKEWCEEHGIGFLPVPIQIGEENFLSGIDIFSNEIIEKLEANPKMIVKTSAVSAGNMKEEYEKGLEEAEKVVYLPIANLLSSTYESAVMMKKQSSDLDNVYVIDSKLSSPFNTVIMPKLAEIVKEQDFDKLMKTIEYYNIDLFGSLAVMDLTWLKQGGRISKAQYLAGNLLKFMPIARNVNGTFEGQKIQKARKIESAIDKMIVIAMEDAKVITDQGLEYQVGYFVHTENHSEDIKIIKSIKEKLTQAGYKGETYEAVLTPGIIVHVGPMIISMYTFRK